jgi:hypothetical protein
VNHTNTKGTTMTTYQAANAKALEMIGMTIADTERTDFFRRSGVKAGKVLRSLGYTRERFPTMGGRAVIQWAAPAAPGEYRQPVALDHVPAFTVLVGVLANNN